ncbi:MAG: tRNA lysidine(34) synthetase TilS [Gemmatimonadales bacterium]
MALLHLVRTLAEENRWHPLAAHFDHGLRADSGEEARQVAGWVEGIGLECRIGAPTDPLPRRQAPLRAARYSFLHEVADEEGAARIATAHHADDQAETVLFRILRGTGVRGLAGIPERRGRIVRPLLGFWREELESYLQDAGIAYLTDPSNVDPRWARALIRTRVLPALESAWDGPVRERLVHVADSARRADQALLAQARQALRRSVVTKDCGGFTFVRAGFARYHPAVQARALVILAERLNVRLSRGGTRVAVEFIKGGQSGASVHVGGGLVLRREFEELWLGPPPPSECGSGILRIEAPGAGEGRVEIGGRSFRVRWAPAKHRAVGKPHDDDEHAYSFGQEDASWPLQVRGWLPGDRIRLRGGSRKLKRLFGDRRISLSERGRIPVLSDAEGRVLWVRGVARAVPADPKRDKRGCASLTIEIEQR